MEEGSVREALIFRSRFCVIGVVTYCKSQVFGRSCAYVALGAV